MSSSTPSINGIPADDPFWQVVIGDPGPELLFDIAVELMRR